MTICMKIEEFSRFEQLMSNRRRIFFSSSFIKITLSDVRTLAYVGPYSWCGYFYSEMGIST